jgi:hypothetical protein
MIAPPRGTRPRGGQYRISFPAPMINLRILPIQQTILKLPQGVRDNVVGSYKSRFPLQIQKVTVLN